MLLLEYNVDTITGFIPGVFFVDIFFVDMLEISKGSGLFYDLVNWFLGTRKRDESCF